MLWQTHQQFKVVLQQRMTVIVGQKKELSASLAGDISLGGEISVRRLGFGAMRLTGEGHRGPAQGSQRSTVQVK
jgi:hypothetical protein